MSSHQTNFSIRPANPDDIEDLLRLIRGIAEYENLTHQLEATPERLHMSLFGDQPVARSLIANASNAGAVGYAIFFYSFSTFLAKPGIYLEDLYVMPEYRGQGIGKALFRAVAEIAREEDCGRMEWMALDWNTPALDFYKANGACLLEEWRLHRYTEADLNRFVGEKRPNE